MAEFSWEKYRGRRLPKTSPGTDTPPYRVWARDAAQGGRVVALGVVWRSATGLWHYDPSAWAVSFVSAGAGWRSRTAAARALAHTVAKKGNAA